MATRKATRGAREVNLPPAGYKRDEVLRERADELDEQAETQAAALELHSIDKSKLEPINEIQSAFNSFNELEVSNPDPLYHYAWINAGYNGLFVKLKLAEKYEVVQGDMQEAIEHKGIAADTTRRIGDVILMRIRKDFYKQVLKRRKAQVERHQQGVTSNLQELGRKYADRGVIVKTVEDGTMDDRTLDIMGKRSTAADKAQAMQEQWIREGRVPGMPAPGMDD